jgi:deoxyribodipyrimidine photo-lyase
MTIQTTRIQSLNHLEIVDGKYVLYWMQQSQRVDCNHALEYAIHEANRLNCGVLVAFGLTDNYPEANLRHYFFMLQGLQEAKTALAARGIQMVVQLGNPPAVALALGKEAGLIVCDRGYLKHQRAWRREVATKAGCRVVQVESDVIVPIEVVSPKTEYAARTIRPKIHRHLDEYLKRLKNARVNMSSLDLQVNGLNMESPKAVLDGLKIDRRVPAVTACLAGGTSKAKALLARFIRYRLKNYDKNSNQPQTDDISYMSPYLHFGQISPLYIALEIMRTKHASQTTKDSYIEELVVRRELAMNFAFYTHDYDKYTCIPGWAKATLDDHRKDRREYIYTRRQLENAETHDLYWNAAMLEMKHTGFMHNYMRMYWGKKILEWSRTPRHAYRTTLALNNKYFLDGRDPNSYAGVAWIYGIHDRAWKERPIFGKTRYMAASGLERKCDIAGYVQKVNALVGKLHSPSHA